MIGDCRTAALVGRNGSIDWLCWPHFHNGACFAALLGSPEHGYWRISPDDQAQATRRYRGDTLILESNFETPAGRVRLIDFMPTGSAEVNVIRIVVGLHGDVRMRMEALFRFDYGQIRPLVSRRGNALQIVAGAHRLVLNSPVAPDVSAEGIYADFTVRAGDRLAFVLTSGRLDDQTAAGPDADGWLQDTQDFWESWIGRFDRQTQWNEAVKRSLITIKALTHRSGGGLVAAPTMGLPEKIGGSLNWDYRYCWLRDATFTQTALLNAGYHEEARQWRDWLLCAAAGSPEKLQVLYQVDGGRGVSETELPWLPGYAGSKPVRRGNAAAGQRQLDVFGEAIDALYLIGKAGLEPADGEFELQSGLADLIGKVWQQPDQGLWEARGQGQNFTYSRAMAWVGIDRFIRVLRQRPDTDPDVIARWEALAQRIHDQVCREGYDTERGHFVAYYGASEVDGSLLLLPLIGFLPIDDPRIAGTIAAVQRVLMQDGLVFRRKTASTGETEGTFLACTCWLADCLTMRGDTAGARKLLQRVLDVRNDVGLLAEEYDVQSQRLVGNFPQALSHLSLINTALQLSGPVLQRGAG